MIFLGTPHRGSPDLAALGEWARSIVSTLRMETTSSILDALSLKTTDLERAQEEFSGLWQKYDFRVKTFQEGFGLTGVNLGVLGNKVVPDYSSLIGDQREHAETIEANHMEMCRFAEADHPNYRKVAGELRSIYLSIVELNAQGLHQCGRIQRHGLTGSAATSSKILDKATGDELNDGERACLRSLWFPSMDTRSQDLEKPAQHTCLWILNHEVYQDWYSDRNPSKHFGLLWLKGKPGAGKSVLMKEAFRQAALKQEESDYWTAAFFFNGKGDELEHSPVGLFRSLLHQLLPRHRELLRRLSKIWDERKLHSGDSGVPTAPWREAELRSFFRSAFAKQPAKRVLIFIDALDECDSKSIQSQAHFWREITKSAYTTGVHLNVCMSSRHFPHVTVSDCAEIVVENHNSQDIAIYVEQKFELSIATSEPQWGLLRDMVLGKSAGVFLWVVLVVEELLGKWDDGKSLRYLQKQLDVIPEELAALFFQMFGSLDSEGRPIAVRLFQWAILAVKPLRLHEWHHILAFIRQPTPTSLREWRLSDDFTKDDDQLERQIKSISRGLIEVRARVDEPQGVGFETMSVRAGAGSLDPEQGETRIVQVIHESVRDFFLRSNGFSMLDPCLKSDPIGNGHVSIMATCLDYLNITELDALVQERIRAEHRRNARRTGKIPSTANSCLSCCSSSLRSTDNPGYEWSTDIKRCEAPPNHTPIPNPDTYPAARIRRHGRHCSRQYSSPHCPTATRKYYERIPSLLKKWKRGGQEEIPVFEALQKLSVSGAKIDITQWMEENKFIANETSPDDSAHYSSMQLSVTGRSQVLDDYPALLSYATFELFTHAQLAEEEGADPCPIIRRLGENGTWVRWVALREDVAQGIELLNYAADQRLTTWVSVISGSPNGTGYFREGYDGYLMDNERRTLLATPDDIGIPGNPAAPRVWLFPDKTRTRAETQIKFQMIFDPLNERFEYIHFPRKTLAKPKHLASPEERKELDEKGGSLYLDVSLVCAAAVEQQDRLDQALRRARGDEAIPRRPAGIAISEIDKEDPAHPQNGGEILICEGCKERERKRYNRKKKRSVDDEEWWSYEDDRVIMINENEFKKWRNVERMIGCDQHFSACAKQVEFAMRVACYCRHQEAEAPVGYRIIFTFKDSTGHLFIQHTSEIFQITDDHKIKEVSPGAIPCPLYPSQPYPQPRIPCPSAAVPVESFVDVQDPQPESQYRLRRRAGSVASFSSAGSLENSYEDSFTAENNIRGGKALRCVYFYAEED